MLAAQGIITPNTVIETEAGQRAKASRINGIRFSSPSMENAFPQPDASTIRNTAVPAYAMEMPDAEWSLDWLAFSSIGKTPLGWFVIWFAKLVYLICLVAVIVTVFSVTFINIRILMQVPYSQSASLIAFVVFLLVELATFAGCLVFIFVIRFSMEIWFVVWNLGWNFYVWLITRRKLQILFSDNPNFWRISLMSKQDKDD